MVRAVREHQKQILIVLPREHRIATANTTREKSHAFVLHRTAIEREDTEVQEVLRFNKLR